MGRLRPSSSRGRFRWRRCKRPGEPVQVTAATSTGPVENGFAMAPGGIQADAQSLHGVLCRESIQQAMRDICLPLGKAEVFGQPGRQRRGVRLRDRKIPAIQTGQWQSQKCPGLAVIFLLVVPNSDGHVTFRNGTLEALSVARVRSCVSNLCAKAGSNRFRIISARPPAKAGASYDSISLADLCEGIQRY